MNDTTSPQAPLVIGIDSGGSKTLALLADETGKVLGRGIAGGANPNNVGIERASAEISLSITRAFASAGLFPRKVAALAIGCAGADNPIEQKRLHTHLTEMQLADEVIISHDGHLLIYAGTPACWGIGMVCGTGSIFYGITEDGRSGRVGGWGNLFGDEGSGYAQGIAVLRAVIKAFDGRGQPTSLTPALLAHWNLQKADDLVTKVYMEGATVQDIAKLSPLVAKCAAVGDAVACEILEHAAEELSDGIVTVVRNLAFANPVPCAFGGGVIINTGKIRALILAKTAAKGVLLNPLTCVSEPAIGAVRIACRALT